MTSMNERVPLSPILDVLGLKDLEQGLPEKSYKNYSS